MEEVPGSNPGGPIIFRRKSEGRKANPRGAGNKDRQGKVRGGQSRRFCECDGRNPGPSMLLTSPTRKELRRAGAFPIIFQRKNEGRKANPRPTTFLTRFAEELRRAIAGEINFRRKVESRKANPGPSMLLTSPTQKELRRAGALPMVLQFGCYKSRDGL